jgi:hypothetical protein
VRPPWTRWSATHPQRRTRLPTSASARSPQKPVRLTHSRALLLGGSEDLGLGMVEAETEAETEKAALLVGRGLGKGLRMARRRGRGLERRDMRGKALRRRSDMVGFWVREGQDWRGFKD